MGKPDGNEELAGQIVDRWNKASFQSRILIKEVADELATLLRQREAEVREECAAVKPSREEEAMTDSSEKQQPRCELCGEPMPEGEAMFKYHGYSGPCPHPPVNVVMREQPAEPQGAREWREKQTESGIMKPNLGNWWTDSRVNAYAAVNRRAAEAERDRLAEAATPFRPLLERLQVLLGSEDITDDDLREASEGLLPNIHDQLLKLMAALRPEPPAAQGEDDSLKRRKP